MLQVVNDEAEGKYRPVIGGYENSKLSSRCIFKFKLSGEYLFKLVNHPRNPPLLKVKVLPEQPLNIIITDDGFLPRIVQIGIFLKFNLDKKYHIIINFNHKMRVHQLNGFGTNYRYHIPFTKLSTVINIVVYFEHLAN